MKFVNLVAFLFLMTTCAWGQEMDVDSIAFTDSLPVEIIYQRSLEGNQINLGRNHFLSFPGSFDDPSRLLIKYPGISTQNDQANFIIYDGMPPHYTKWTLYGADIINPNHLSNAGTISDRNSRASGGVNSFSGQILGNFSYRAQPGMEGDLLSHAGSANMKLRTPYENKLFFNVSAIGLEAGIERKLNDSGTSNLVANYRYSFTGLLGQLGVDFGGEVIAFQDAYAKIELDNTLNGKLSLFGMYGASSNDHAAQDSITILKDALDIRYDANILVLGANHVTLDQRLNTSLIYSSRSDIRNSSKPAGFLPTLDVGNSSSEINESRISFHTLYDASTRFRYGLKSSIYSFDPDSQISPEVRLTGVLSYVDFFPYVRTTLIQKEKLNLSATLGAYYETAFSEFSILPSAKITYALGNEFNVGVDYSLTTQMQAPELYQATSQLIGTVNQNLSRSQGHHLRIGVSNDQLSLSGFYHRLNDLAGPQPGPTDFISAWFTDLSNLDIIPNQALGNNSNADIFGISASYDKSFANDFYLSTNVTLLNSQTSFMAITVDTPYDFGSILNLRIQKKFELSRYKYFNISSAFHYRGGSRESEIDLEASKALGRTIINESIQPHSIKLEPYHRLDLRISYVKKKSGKSKYKSVISMDIQNLYGRENDAFNFYDPVTDQIELQKQLGLLPVISYRIEF